MSGKITTIFILLILLQTFAFAQETGTLSVILRDPNGDLIADAIITITNEQGEKVVDSKPVNSELSNLNLGYGKYILEIQSPGFKVYRQELEINEKTKNITVRLEIEEISVNVEVEQTEREKRIDEAFGGFLSEEEINNLPEDGESIKEELKRRYGDDVMIRVDGDFSGSQIPSRDQISSIKVIRNSFDAEFHEIASIIIDIRTKADANGFHGLVSFSFNDSLFNARNAFDFERLPEQRKILLVSLFGPIIPKKTAFSLSIFRIDSFDTRNFVGVLPNEFSDFQQRTKIKIGFSTFSIKHNLPNAHLLGLSYQFNDVSLFSLGPLDLPERGFTRSMPRHRFIISESGVFGKKYLNDFRIEFGKAFKKFTPESDETTIIVLDAFNRGGAGLNQRDDETAFELADILTFEAGNHSLKFGTEIEYVKLKSVAANNLNGRFVFSSPANFVNANPSQYQRTLGATNVEFSQLRTAFYFQDYLKIGQPLQLSLGFRFERQNGLNDANNFSPRFGYVWSPEKSGKFIVRGGFGIFYVWLDTDIVASILANDGRQGQNLIIINPGFPDPFAGGTISQTLPASVSRLADDLINPQIFVAQNGFNYKFSKMWTFEGIYTFRRGLNHFRSRDTNAPLNGVRPNPDFGVIRLLESSGRSSEHSFDLRINTYFKGINFYTNYQLAKRTDDFYGALNLPTDSRNLALDRGVSDLDQTHKLNFSFSFDVWKIKVSPSFKIESGIPYTITTGSDDNGNTVFNDRPFGIERNSVRGEWFQQTDVRFQWKLPLKYVGFGNDKKRSLNLNVNVRNLTNTTNLRNYVGVQTSPFFKQAIAANTARTVDVGVSFSF